MAGPDKPPCRARLAFRSRLRGAPSARAVAADVPPMMRDPAVRRLSRFHPLCLLSDSIYASDAVCATGISPTLLTRDCVTQPALDSKTNAPHSTGKCNSYTARSDVGPLQMLHSASVENRQEVLFASSFVRRNPALLALCPQPPSCSPPRNTSCSARVQLPRLHQKKISRGTIHVHPSTHYQRCFTVLNTS